MTLFLVTLPGAEKPTEKLDLCEMQPLESSVTSLVTRSVTTEESRKRGREGVRR